MYELFTDTQTTQTIHIIRRNYLNQLFCNFQKNLTVSYLHPPPHNDKKKCSTSSTKTIKKSRITAKNLQKVRLDKQWPGKGQLGYLSIPFKNQARNLHFFIFKAQNGQCQGIRAKEIICYFSVNYTTSRGPAPKKNAAFNLYTVQCCSLQQRRYLIHLAGCLVTGCQI